MSDDIDDLPPVPMRRVVEEIAEQQAKVMFLERDIRQARALARKDTEGRDA